MKIKEHEYVRQTLERYTNCKLEDFCDHVLITNFKNYIKRFKEKTKGTYCEGKFRIANAKDINCTMIDFGIGSPQAAHSGHRYGTGNAFRRGISLRSSHRIHYAGF